MIHTGRTRSWLVVVIAIVVVLGVAIAFLPAIASIWPGPSIVRGLVQEQVAGDVNVDVGNVTLRWAGPHTIRDVVIRDPDSDTSATLDITLDTTFLALALSRVDHYRVTVSGEAAGNVRENGKTSFAQLLPDDKKKPDEEPLQSDQKNVKAMPRVDVDILNFTLTLDDQSIEPAEQVVFEVRRGAASLGPGQPITFDVTGVFPDGDTPGRLSIGATIENLIAGDGELTLNRATLSAKGNITGAPLPGIAEVQRIESLDLAASSDNLAERIRIDINTDMALRPPKDASDSADWPDRSTLRANLTVLNAINDQMQLDIDPSLIAGEIHGASLPAGLLQPMVENTPLVVQRDIGRTVDFDAEITADTTADTTPDTERAPPRSAITANLRADNFTAELSGAVNAQTQAIDVETFKATTTMQPALFNALAAPMSIASPTPIIISGSTVRVPVRSNGKYNYAELAGDVQLTVSGAVDVLRAGENGESQTVATLENVRVTAKTDQLDDGLNLNASAGIESGTLSVQQLVANIVNNDGSLVTDWRELQPVGTITLRDLPLNTIERFAAQRPDALQPYLVGVANLDVRTKVNQAERLTADMNVTAQKFTLTAHATRHADKLVVDSANLIAPIHRELLAELQAQREQPIGLARAFPADIHLIEPLAFPADEATGYALPSQRVTLAIDTNDPIVLTNVPALVEPLELRDTSLHVLAPLRKAARQEYRLVGAAQWHTRSTDRTVGDINFEVNWPADVVDEQADGVSAGLEQEPQHATVDISLQRLAVRRLERAIGREVDSIARWIGPFGDIYIDATINPQTNAVSGTLQPDLRQFAGRFEFAYTEDDIIALSGSTSKMLLTAEALNNTFNMTEPAQQAMAQSAEPGTEAGNAYVTADVPAGLDIEMLRAPLALLNNEPVESAELRGQVRADMTFTAGPLVLAHVAGDTTEVRNFRAHVQADDISEPVTLDIDGDVQSTDRTQPGKMKLTGKLTDILTGENRVKLAQGRLDLNASGSELPTAIVDGLGNFDGLLVAAIGEIARGDVEADDLSRDTGHIDAALEAPHATLNAWLLARGGKLRVREQNPLVAELELTPELRERILQAIHPIFADVRHVKNRIVIRMIDGGIPLDGDISGLDADLKIIVGDVELTAGSLFLGLMRLGQVTGREVVQGRIDPITARIRNGVLTFDVFSMSIDKYSTSWGGSINLATGEVDLQTELPLNALGQTFEEVADYVQDVVVPIRSTGKIGDVKYEVDPSFDLGKVLQNAGLQKLLDDELGDFGDIFGNFLNQNRDPTRKQEQESDQPPADDQ